ncbi:MAG: trypsin-like peptidase domain-containing protein [Nitrospirae bacterium]|nr:trypsin-like peptidase domain-containing protein [Nitrospirota bacterium]
MDQKSNMFAGRERYGLLVMSALVVVLAFWSLRDNEEKNGFTPDGFAPADFSMVVERVLPSMVEIDNLNLAGHPEISGLEGIVEVPQASAGSGFFIGKDGLILTNYHVVDGAEALKVTTSERKIYDAELVGADAFADIALIKIKPDFKVVPATLGDSARLKAGQWVLAMGNPLGLLFFTSAGIVSGFGPPGPNYIGFFDFIQTDANIEPGNSGGPLLDTHGRVVGINNAYMGPGTGIGFAIPINRAKDIVAQLQKDGKVTRGFLGVVGQPLTPGLAERLGLQDVSGALISDVLADSPAGSAGGLKAGDVVLDWNGEPVKDYRGFQEKIYTTAPGTKVDLRVVRDRKYEGVTVTLGELEAHSVIKERVIKQCGITLQEVDSKVAGRFGAPRSTGGLLVLKVTPGCPAYEGGLRFGDIIKKVEGMPISTIGEFYRQYSSVRRGSQVLIQVLRGGRPVFITIEQVAEG